jgi:hypothetical protein
MLEDNMAIIKTASRIDATIDYIKNVLYLTTNVV